MITKIKVVMIDGGEIDISTAFIRNIMRIIDGSFGYLVGEYSYGGLPRSRDW